MSVLSTIQKLTKQLYPTGRAFKISSDGVLDKLHKGLSASEARAYADAKSILDSALPDNDNFTAEDATDWERRLGLITNPIVSLADRKLAIKRKMGFSFAKGRSSYLFLQGQLQAAGFDVYVHENRFDLYPSTYQTKTAIEVALAANGSIEHGEFEHGEFEHGDIGESLITLIVNHINEDPDQSFDVGANLRSTFFIGGNPVGIYADVPLERKDEFRQLILRIKPVQTVGYLFINYI